MTNDAFCPRCGIPRLGSFRYCRSCQFDFDAMAPAVVPAPVPVAAVPAAAQPRAKGAGWAVRVAFVMIAGFAVVVTAGWLTSQRAKVDDIVATATGWTLDRAQTFAESEGFTGKDSPLADGRPRWLASRSSDEAVFEAVGQPASIEQVSLVLPVTVDNASPMGALVGRALAVWLPEAADWLTVAIVDVVDQGGDVSKSFTRGSVRVQSIVFSDGSMVTVTVSRIP